MSAEWKWTNARWADGIGDVVGDVLEVERPTDDPRGLWRWSATHRLTYSAAGVAPDADEAKRRAEVALKHLREIGKLDTMT